MNFISKKSIFTFIIVLLSFTSFALPADPDVAPDPPAPINDYIFVLMAIGICLIAIKFRQSKKQYG